MSSAQQQAPVTKDDALKELQDKLRETVVSFIRDIFNYEKIEVTVKKGKASGFNRFGAISPELTEQDGHVAIDLSYNHIEKAVDNFEIRYIPALPNSSHIRVFFASVLDYIHYFYGDLLNGYASSVDLEAFKPHIFRANNVLDNLHRTVMTLYLFRIFNSAGSESTGYHNQISHVEFDLAFINTLLNFAIELNTRKIENEEISCGFLFHKTEAHITDNSVRRVRLGKEIDFGDFNALKNYLNTSNGQDLFFNVTNGKITHLFLTKKKINEIYMNPSAEGKTFMYRPMIMSVQGTGKILFIEGRQANKNQSILEINNSRPLIRDGVFVHNRICETLSTIYGSLHAKIEFFARWIISLSQKKHGTSLIFLNVDREANEKLVASLPIIEESGEFLDMNSPRHDMFLLNNLTKPDGAVIFNSELIPTHISTILPINTNIKSRLKGGGARHNSVANFTEAFNCTGIVVSEDGPISIFRNGDRINRF